MMSLWGEPVLSVVLASGYLGLFTLMWLGLLVGVPRWGRGFELPVTAPPAGARPSVSVCIPARNEALNIGACVRRALDSDWPELEVVVVDDRSEDDTAGAAVAAAAGDPRLLVVPGSPPPPGWAGKAWACTRAAGEARSDLILFIDADVRLDPRAVSSLVAERDAAGVELLSAFGTWEVVSFWERAVIPTVGWLIRGAVDLGRVNDPGKPEAFANGQLILVRRAAYEAVGGHAAIKDQILDDVRLAELFKRRGHPIGLRVAPWAFSVRLYRSLQEIYAGYAKNLYEGMGRRPLIGLGAVLFIAVGTLLPFAAALAALALRLVWGWAVPGWEWVGWLFGLCLLQLAFRWRIERRDGRSGALAWVHPISNMVLVAILLRSVFGVRVQWKGRDFVDGRAAGDGAGSAAP